MANEGGSSAERAVSFIVRLLVSLIISAWGLMMLMRSLKSGEGLVDRDGWRLKLRPALAALRL